MRADGLLPSDVLEFDAILETCAAIQDKVKRLACGQPLPSSMQITNERTQPGLMLSLLGVIAEQSIRSPRELPVNDCVRCLPTTTFLQQLPLSVLFILATFPATARACEPCNHSTRTAIGAGSPRAIPMPSICTPAGCDDIQSAVNNLETPNDPAPASPHKPVRFPLAPRRGQQEQMRRGLAWAFQSTATAACGRRLEYRSEIKLTHRSACGCGRTVATDENAKPAGPALPNGVAASFPMALARVCSSPPSCSGAPTFCVRWRRGC